MREFRMYIPTMILYLGIFVFLVCFIGSPFFGVVFLFNKLNNWLLLIFIIIASTLAALLISEIYTIRHPIKIRVDDKRIVMHSIFQESILNKDEILRVKAFKPLWGSDWGQQYIMEVSIKGKMRTFSLNSQVIKDLDGFIRLVSLDVYPRENLVEKNM